MTELSEQLKIFFSALSPLTKHDESAFFGKKTGQAIVEIVDYPKGDIMAKKRIPHPTFFCHTWALKRV